MKNTFRKYERLCSCKLIDTLFDSGYRIMVYPFSVYWCVCETTTIPSQTQVLIGVSKRKFKHAVDRNKIKRLIRECFRLHKQELYIYLIENNCKILVSINYIHGEIPSYSFLEKKYLKMLTLLKDDIRRKIVEKENKDLLDVRPQIDNMKDC